MGNNIGRVSAADQILATLAGGLSGAAKGYAWEKEYEQKDREIENKKEVTRLQGELRMMLESVKDDTRRDLHNTASGNVIAQQAGATARNDADNATTVTVATDRNAVTTRGQDITQSLGIARDATTQRGQNLNFTLGGMRDATTRRGQDTTATTARRGQDITQSLGIANEAGRNDRATDVNALREQEIEQRDRLEKAKRADPWSGVNFNAPVMEVKEETGTGKPTAQPIDVKEKPTRESTLPVVTRSPEAGADQSARLEQQARGLMTQFQNEKDPAKKAAFRTQLQRVRDELIKAGSARKGPGL